MIRTLLTLQNSFLLCHWVWFGCGFSSDNKATNQNNNSQLQRAQQIYLYLNLLGAAVVVVVVALVVLAHTGCVCELVWSKLLLQ